MAVTILVLLMFTLGASVVFGGYYGLTRLPEAMAQRRLNARLASMTAAPDEDQGEPSGLVKARKGGPLPGLDRLVSGSDRGLAWGSWIEQSGVKITVSGLLVLSVLSGGIVGTIGWLLSHKLIGFVIGAVVGMLIPFGYLKAKRSRRINAFEEMFPEALDLIARALKAGHAFATGLKMAADEMQDPVGPEFRKTFDEQNFGLPLKDALNNLTTRIPLLDVRFFSTAVLIQRETGGNLAEILENLAHVVRERFKILRQVRVHTAHGRLTAYVLLGLPVFLAIALSFINPEHMGLLFKERMGHIMLLGTLVLQIIGYFWIKHVIKIEV